MGLEAWLILLTSLGVTGFLAAIVVVTAWVVRTARIPRPVPVRAHDHVGNLRERLRRGEITGAQFQSTVVRLGRDDRH